MLKKKVIIFLEQIKEEKMDNLEEIKNQITNELNEQIEKANNELKNLANKLANEFEKQVKKMKSKDESKRWRAETGNKYFFVDDYANVISCHDNNDMTDNYRFKMRNYFKTKEEAEEYKEVMNTYYDLMDLAEKLDNGEKINWNDKGQYKNSLFYDYDSDTIEQESIYGYQELGQIYCLDENFKEKAIEKIGKDKLIKLFKYERG